MSSFLPIDIIKKLPKAELHCHLDGSVRVSTIIELAKEQNVELPTYDANELTKLVCVTMNCTSLEEYLRGFEITLRVLQKPYALTRAMFEVCEDAYLDGVRYLEVRFSPILHVNEGLSLSSVMEAVVQGQAMAEFHFNIKVRIIVCGMRQLPASVTEDLAQIAWRYRHKGVAGFDLAGPEHGFSSKNHAAAFDIVRAKCVNCTLHSGEGDGPESIQDSIHYCGAKRIGHGTSLGKDPTLMQFVIDRRIPLEVCVTSNVQTKAVNSLEQHPIRNYFDAGVIIVPCTDNTTVSSVSLSGEYDLIQRTFHFSPVEIVRLIDYGFSSAFVGVAQRQRFRVEAIRMCVEVLRDNGYNEDALALSQVRQFDDIGVDIQQLCHPPEEPHSVLSGTFNDHQLLTIDVIKALPKTDLHCRFDGAVSPALLWQELKTAKVDLKKLYGIQCSTLAEFQKLIQPEVHTKESKNLAKTIMKSLLQNKGQLERAMENILRDAVSENVCYLELVLRPKTHTKQGLSQEEVLETILSSKERLKAQLPSLKVSVVIYVSTNADDPLDFRKSAELAVTYRSKGVNGFGVFGDSDIPVEAFSYFNSTFDYLKSNNLNVVMFAGKSDGTTMTKAVHNGGASRLSGCFTLHKYPRLMNYLAMHNIPIELNTNEKLFRLTEEIHTFADPFRLLMDNGVAVTLCSFRGSLYRTTRSEHIFHIIESCKFTVSETLNVIGNGFKFNFQSFAQREQDFAHFRSFAVKYLRDRGLKNLNSHHYHKSLPVINNSS